MLVLPFDLVVVAEGLFEIGAETAIYDGKERDACEVRRRWDMDDG